jgi:Esterase/lipase
MKSKKQKILIFISSIILILFLLVFAGYKFFANFLVGQGVSDYETRLEIWGEDLPGYSTASKLDDMNINYKSNVVSSTFSFIKHIVGAEYRDEERALDTFTYQFEIKNGFEKETYEDRPYLIPYISEGSDSAVIVIPGGGFAYKSIHGSTSEGKDIAEKLNDAGITAFVLSYRSNPYEYPIPQLDVQRAVKYIKYHSAEYGINSDKIGLIGFSAGGNQVGTYINLIMGNDLLPEDYIRDEVDMVDDTVIAPAMIYPALTYQYNVPMLFCMFEDDLVRDENTRIKLLNQMDLKQHINKEVINQFVSYGTSDGMVGMDGAKAYIESARDNGIDIVEVVAEDQDHGYDFSYYGDEYISWLKKIFNLEN